MSDPITLARGAYWRGRAAEAAGEVEEMRAQYEAAARYSTAYYGQLARARLGLYDVVSLRSPPEPADANANEVLHAGDILYQIGEGDLALSFVTDLAGESGDPALIAGLGKLTRTVPRCAGDATRRQDGSSERFPNGVVRFSRRRCTGLHPNRFPSRSLHGLCHRAHGKWLRPA